MGAADIDRYIELGGYVSAKMCLEMARVDHYDMKISNYAGGRGGLSGGDEVVVCAEGI